MNNVFIYLISFLCGYLIYNLIFKINIFSIGGDWEIYAITENGERVLRFARRALNANDMLIRNRWPSIEGPQNTLREWRRFGLVNVDDLTVREIPLPITEITDLEEQEHNLDGGDPCGTPVLMGA